jgi:transcriptional regulator with XRE-family HTH domain
MADDTRDPGSLLGDRIEQLRRDRGLTVEQLTESAELDRAELEAVADGVDVSIFSISRIAGALGVELDDLLDGISWTPGEGGDYRVEDPGPS